MRSCFCFHTAILTAIALLAAACGGVAPALDREADVAELSGPDTEAIAMTAETAAESALTLGTPLTLRLEPSASLVEMIESLGSEAAAERSLRLTLDGLERPNGHFGVRVFVNTPGADAGTALDSLGYIGDFAFSHSGDYGLETGSGEDRFLIDLGSRLARLGPAARLVEDRFIDVTLIMMPMGEAAGTDAAGTDTATDGAVAAETGALPEIPFKGVRLSTHRNPPSGS